MHFIPFDIQIVCMKLDKAAYDGKGVQHFIGRLFKLFRFDFLCRSFHCHLALIFFPVLLDGLVPELHCAQFAIALLVYMKEQTAFTTSSTTCHDNASCLFLRPFGIFLHFHAKTVCL